MLLIWLLLTSIAGLMIYSGSKLYNLGHQQLGTVLMLGGIFQIFAELIAIL